MLQEEDPILRSFFCVKLLISSLIFSIICMQVKQLSIQDNEKTSYCAQNMIALLITLFYF